MNTQQGCIIPIYSAGREGKELSRVTSPVPARAGLDSQPGLQFQGSWRAHHLYHSEPNSCANVVLGS